MSSALFSRRKFFETGTVAAAAAGVAAIPGAAFARQPQEGGSGLDPLFPPGGAQRFFLSQQNAYLFLDTMMDAYAQGLTTRLSQSYSDEIGLESTAFFYDNAVEIMAWTGMALAQLAHRTGISAYLDGAVRLGNWIFNNAFDTRGPGGYNFTLGPNQVKSTEHNID